MSYVPVPCVLLPERVKEYPPMEALPDDLREKLLAGLEGHPLPYGILDGFQLYGATLSVCPASKVGGYLSSTEHFEVPACSCGSPMEYLLTIAGDEIRTPRWLPLEERHLFDGTARTTYGWADAHGLLCGYTAEFFLCRQCGGWPTRYVANFD